MSDEGEDMKERLEELEAENNAIKEFLAKYVKKGPTRRQVLKSGTVAAGAGMMGFGAGNASAQASTEDGDGNVGDPDNRVDVFADAADVNALNSIHMLDPDASDWGAAMNSLFSNVSAGDTIIVPSVDYTTDTKAVADKSLSIVGFGGEFSISGSKPEIAKTSDVTILETSPQTRVQIKGLDLGSNMADTTPGIEAQHQCVIKGCSASNIGGPAFYLNQATTDSNLNNSRVEIAAREGASDAIRVENNSADQGSPNVNAMSLTVHNSFNQSGWAVNLLDGIGNRINVQNAEGSSTGAVKIGGGSQAQRNSIDVQYVEIGGGPAVQFDDSINHATVWYAGSVSQTFVFNADENYGADFTGNDRDITIPFGSLGVDGDVDLQTVIGSRTKGSINNVITSMEGSRGQSPADSGTLLIGPDVNTSAGDYGARLMLGAYDTGTEFGSYGSGLQVKRGPSDVRDRVLEFYNSNINNKNYVWASVTPGGLVEFFDASGNKTAELTTSGDLNLAGSVSENVTF